MTSPDHLATGIATALLAGSWTRPQMSLRARRALGLDATPDWLRALVREVAEAYRDPPGDRPRELAGFLLATPAWPASGTYKIKHRTPAPLAIARRPWPVTELPDLAALARLLWLDQGELAWFADVQGRERRCPPRLRHYAWTRLPSGRLVAAPKSRLKEIQRRLLRHVLEPIPVHDAAHGAVPNRSVRTALAPHASAPVVIRLDLRVFFASVPAPRVYGLLRVAGLPEPVAHTVTGLMTTVAPLAVSRELAVPHLPQGAPTSPRLANLVAYSLDRRLSGLVARYGGTYTRYVDDLVFSGGPPLRNARSRFVHLVEQIADDEGFAVHERKTVVLGAAGRQRLLGAVVNAHPALPRADRDALRATLHNCVVRGWASQARGRDRDEFRAYLLGRIAWAGSLRPEHGRRLRAIADQIDWTG